MKLFCSRLHVQAPFEEGQARTSCLGMWKHPGTSQCQRWIPSPDFQRNVQSFEGRRQTGRYQRLENNLTPGAARCFLSGWATMHWKRQICYILHVRCSKMSSDRDRQMPKLRCVTWKKNLKINLTQSLTCCFTMTKQLVETFWRQTKQKKSACGISVWGNWVSYGMTLYGIRSAYCNINNSI